EVLRYLGYAGQEADSAIFERIDRIIEECQRDLAPKNVVGYFAVDAANRDRLENPSIALVGTSLVLPGKDIACHLGTARECALLACTLGAKSEQELARRKAINPLDALIYDSACSALVERVADSVEATIVESAARRGLFTNSRYSPGYGDLPLSVQPTFLKVIGAFERIGLTVTKTNLLLPTKSITAIVGIFDEPPSEEVERSCSSCNMKDFCAVRASGKVCHG
ncbi:MAG: vitamin B12 dependent methionine synthase, partial [Raoultibacter sp.]